MLTIALAVALSRPIPQRVELCPGATYFIKHGKHAAWNKGRRPLCTIGGHDFYGDPPTRKPKPKKSK